MYYLEQSLAEFNWWKTFSSCLQLTVDYWDITLQGGISIDSRTSARHDLTWVNKYRGKTIIMPFNKPDLISTLMGGDIIEHFIFHNRQIGSNESPYKYLDSCLLILGGENQSIRTKICEEIFPSYTISGEAFSGRHVRTNLPTKEFVEQRAKEIYDEQIKLRTKDLLCGYEVTYNPQESKNRGYINYGSIRVMQVPYAKLYKLANIPQWFDYGLPLESLESLLDFERCTERQANGGFQTTGKLFRITVGVLATLPIRRKVSLLAKLMNSLRPAYKWVFIHQSPNQSTRYFTLTEFIVAMLYSEIKDEVFEKLETLPSLTLFVQEIEENTTTYNQIEGLIIQLWSIMTRLNIVLFWRKLMLASNMKKSLQALEIRLEQVLFSNAYAKDKLKRDAKVIAEDKNRLRIDGQDTFLDGVFFPFIDTSTSQIDNAPESIYSSYQS